MYYIYFLLHAFFLLLKIVNQIQLNFPRFKLNINDVMLDDLGACASANLFSEVLEFSSISLLYFMLLTFIRNCFYLLLLNSFFNHLVIVSFVDFIHFQNFLYLEISFNKMVMLYYLYFLVHSFVLIYCLLHITK